MQDLAALRDDLPLLAGVAVLEEDVDLGQRVEGDLVRVDTRLERAVLRVRADLALELVDRRRAGAADGLVGIDDHPLEAHAVAQRHQQRDELHRRAVRVGDDPVMLRGVARVDLADHERHAELHAPGVRVVDHDRATLCGFGRELARDVGAGREQGDIDALEGRRASPLRRSGSGRRPRSRGRPSVPTRAGATPRPGIPARAAPGSSSGRRRRWHRRPRP